MNRGTLLLALTICTSSLSPGCAASAGVVCPPSDELSGGALFNTHDDAFPKTNQLASLNLIFFDVSDLSRPVVKIKPLRNPAKHFNVLKFLEFGSCTDCLQVVVAGSPAPGILDVDISLKHPFEEFRLTGFDVRGIMMNSGSHLFPASGLTYSNSDAGDGELLNADGYTTLYNFSTAGLAGELQTYIKGKHATDIPPDALLNGFRDFRTEDPLNIRNAFYPSDIVTRTYTINMPSTQFVLGYAVDGSWNVPLADPVTDPQVDFGLYANSLIPWKILITEEPAGDGLTETGGSTTLKLDIYDWQGKASHSAPIVECPELFSGALPAVWQEDGADYSRYSVSISNSLLASAGTYKCLVSTEDNENQTSPPWMDLTAYQVASLPVSPAKPKKHELWYYDSVNLLVDQNLEDAITLMQTAYDAGYRHAMIADFKFGTIDIQSQTYWDHVQAFKEAADQIGMEIIPSLVPIGYSNSVLSHDPNLIEGQPVSDCVFNVDGSTASVVQDPSTNIANGGFENHSGDAFPGWIQMDGAGVTTFADTSNVHSGSTSIRMENFTSNQYGHCRIRQEVQVKPWNCYVVSFWMKTSGLSNPSGFNVLTFDKEFDDILEFLEYDINSTQNWTKYYTVFNSQENDSVNLYFGMWGGEDGQLWLDDITIENAGLINLIRRDGCPVRVTSEDGLTEYQEGVDFEYVEDPLTGHAGSYTGTFDLYHEHPVITLTPGSSIQDGENLLVDYYHCTFIYDMQTACCLTEEAVFDIFDSTLSKVSELINPQRVFIAVDELRVVNWCDLCQSTGKTPGQLLADATLRVEEIAHDINPDWKLIVWSDMYDPNHNAHDGYYLSNGTLEGSWAGLGPDWDIANWSIDNPDSLAWFESLGNRQILCGYYDESGSDFTIDDWLDMSINTEGVYAVMYTTWWKGYDDLEAWAQVVKDWDEANW